MAARGALLRKIPPASLVWNEIDGAQPSLDIFEDEKANGSGDTPVAGDGNNVAGVRDKSVGAPQFRVPKAFLQLAHIVALHRDERRWALLYRLLWRLIHGERKLLEVVVDPDVALASEFIRRDVHKMRAFVRSAKSRQS